MPTTQPGPGAKATTPLPTAALLSHAAGATLAAQLADRLAERISQRLLAPGARLPSVRECARHQGVSPSTVVGAYDLLQARGLVQARPQRGFFVRDAASAAPARRHAPAPASMPAPVDATALIRSMFQAQGGLPAPGMGTLPEAWLDATVLQRALRRVCNSPDAWLSYGEPAGDALLRSALAQRLADLGVAATPGQIVTTVGATHALDLVCRTLLQPGDAVLVDEPGWAVEYARLTRLGMRLLPVPRGADGPDLAVMAALLREHQPRLYVTVSVLHNPTGNSLTPASAHQVLRLAEAHDLTIVEDDTYSWLAPMHATRLVQLDALQRTVYVTGFSKILTPQWRVGCLAAAPELAERLIDTKLISTLTTPGPAGTGGGHLPGPRRLTPPCRAGGDPAAGGTPAHPCALVRDSDCHFRAEPAGLFGWVDVGVDTETTGPAPAGRRLAHGTRLAVPRHTTANVTDARQLRHGARRTLLAAACSVCVHPLTTETPGGRRSMHAVARRPIQPDLEAATCHPLDMLQPRSRPTGQHASEMRTCCASANFNAGTTETARAVDTSAAGSTRLSSLNPSLLQDLMRFDEPAAAPARAWS
jgi:DNA-binding transcriptional MocR family regulator